MTTLPPIQADVKTFTARMMEFFEAGRYLQKETYNERGDIEQCSDKTHKTYN